MPAIATFGPTQTFSEMAAKKYAKKIGGRTSVRLYPTYRKVFAAVGGACRYGVVPIENMLEGYVQPVLDLLLSGELNIVDELILPIEFSFVADCPSLKKVKRVYAQFVTQGQCAEFLEGVSQAEVVTTASNGLSLEQVLKHRAGEGAIVPRKSVRKGAFPLVVERVNDYENNRTRFIAIARDQAPYDKARQYKTSLVIVEGMDRPGMLADILAAFAKRSINLVSIMSRPTKESLGKYHFFVDIEGHGSLPHIEDALAEIQRHNFVRSLGSYPRAVADS